MNENESNLLTVNCPVSSVIEYYGNQESLSKYPNWVFADGRLLSKQEHQELYLAIGDTYGETDTHFHIVDKRARVAVGAVDYEDLGLYEGSNSVSFRKKQTGESPSSYLEKAKNINGVAHIYSNRQISSSGNSPNLIHCHFIMRVK